mgnify:CR=1 FL=1
MAVHVGIGTKLEKDTTGGGAWRTIAQCRSISGPSYEGDEIDVTTHDSVGGFREFVRGLVDPGEISAELVFDPNHASHAATGLIDDLKSGATDPYRIDWVMASKILTFTAFVKSFPLTSPIDDVLTGTVTLRITGDITLT